VKTFDTWTVAQTEAYFLALAIRATKAARANKTKDPALISL